MTFSLPVTDNKDAVCTNATTTNILVKNVNQPPVAQAIVRASTTVYGVTLEGSSSNDPDSGIITSYG